MTYPQREDLWAQRSWTVKADLDKPHRCPSCYTGAAVWDSPRRRMRWHVYTCPRCGQDYGQGFWRRTAEGYRHSTGWLHYVWWWRRVRAWKFWTRDVPEAYQHGDLRLEIRLRYGGWKWINHDFCAEKRCWRLQNRKPHSIYCQRHLRDSELPMT